MRCAPSLLLKETYGLAKANRVGAWASQKLNGVSKCPHLYLGESGNLPRCIIIFKIIIIITTLMSLLLFIRDLFTVFHVANTKFTRSKKMCKTYLCHNLDNEDG